MTKETKREELLVENAILKYNEQVRRMLKEELSPLTRRIDSLEDRVKEVEGIVEPLGVIRKRFWFFLIALTLASGVASNKVADYIGSLTK